MWPTRPIAYVSGAVSASVTLMVIQLTRILTTAYHGPRVSVWMVGALYVTIPVAVEVMYVIDRLGRARRVVDS
jgi:hypothetical protein